MASFGNEDSFDAENVAPKVPMVPLPVNDYIVVITESENKPTSKGNGSYLLLVLEVIEGEYKNRKLYVNLNLDNPNDQAVSIARAELSAICRAVGVMKPRDSSELHNLPFVVKVGMGINKETKEQTNKIKGYLSKDAAKATPGTPAGAKAQASGPPKTPPWKKAKPATPPAQPAAATQTTEVM